MSLLSVYTARHANRYVIAVTGDIDLSTAGRVDHEIRRAEATDADRIVVDLSSVTFMDSGAVHLLLAADARSRANGNRLRLVKGSRPVHLALSLTGAEDVLPFLDK